ncbi:hypothetical protein [Conexibacter arvalis]|uniref:hypothetical protein n=1 Tax=Conexibacter arvalis TaxID=912552 RepID=UPI00161467A5|nr:hypothetical protein [Conexibacter arvalis]
MAPPLDGGRWFEGAIHRIDVLRQVQKRSDSQPGICAFDAPRAILAAFVLKCHLRVRHRLRASLDI